MDEENLVPGEEKETAEEQEKHDEKSISADLIRGHINTIILRSLYDGDKYGYEIIAEIEQKSHGQYSLKQPSLYSALKRLETQNYITSYWGGSVGGGRRKYFSLTEEGKKISEQNQSEWEYSRTVIDSLISDKDFDFNNPAPSAVNMRVLKGTTSRVPHRDGEGYDEDFEYSPAYPNNEEMERQSAELEAQRRALEEQRAAWEEERARTEAEFNERNEAIRQEREEREAALRERELLLSEERERLQTEKAELSKSSEAASELDAYSEQLKEREREIELERVRYEQLLRDREEQLSLERATHARELEEQEKRIREEQEALFRQRERQRIHENYIQLVNTPPEAPEEEKSDYNYYTQPVADERLQEPASEIPIYNNKPESEREYRSVINRLYQSAVKQERSAPPASSRPEGAQPLGGIDFYDLEAKAQQDGIKISTAGGTAAESAAASQSIVNKGKALFLSALVVFFICLAEGSIVLALQPRFGYSLFLPFFIWGTALALLLVTGVAFANHYGERALRRTRPILINAIVIYALLIIFTLIIALGVNIDFTNPSALAAYVVIPIIFFFGVVIFGIVYYLQVRPNKD